MRSPGSRIAAQLVLFTFEAVLLAIVWSTGDVPLLDLGFVVVWFGLCFLERATKVLELVEDLRERRRPTLEEAVRELREIDRRRRG